MAHHEEPQIAIHMLAAVPHGTFLECFAPERDPGWYQLVANRPAIKNGVIDVPQGAGFDLVLDQAAIKKYRID
jgi:D-galactarolactone cycloisomerase